MAKNIMGIDFTVFSLKKEWFQAIQGGETQARLGFERCSQ